MPHHIQRLAGAGFIQPCRTLRAAAPVRRCLAAALLVAFAGMPLVAPETAKAATIVVNSTADVGTASTCTLRQAIVSTNDGAVVGGCTNIGGAFGDDTIQFANGLFAGGTPTITLGSSLNIGNVPNGHGGIVSTHLAIDAGTGRKVIVERAAGATQPFTPITAAMGYYNAHGGAKGQLRLSGLIVRNGIATYELSKYGTSIMGNDDINKYGVSSGGGLVSRYADVIIDRCEFRNNSATVGGAMYVGGGTLSMDSSIVSGNVADGGTAHFRAGWGGGIYTTNSARISHSTISGNTSTGTRGGSAIASLFGGLSLVNSTVSGNSTPSQTSPAAAAISLSKPYTPVSLTNSTLACNTASNVGGGGALYIKKTEHTSLTAISTIFADTSNSRCTTAVSREITIGGSGLTVAGDHNLIVSNSAIDASAPFASAPITGDPKLGVLQNNGGPTPTHAIDDTSPARNKGSNPGALGNDQRGPDYGRSVGGSPDIGAFEYQIGGLCGSAHGGSFASLNAGSPNLCAAGMTMQSLFGTGPWSWFCAAPGDPSNNEFCGAKVLASTSLVVNTAADVPTASAFWGQPLHLKATVSGGAGTPAGTVSFLDVTGGGVVPVCINLALAGGQAVCDTTGQALTSGSRQIKAIFNGGSIYGAASSGAASLAVGRAVSTTSIASQVPNPVTVGSPFKVTAAISLAAPSTAAPYGVVEIVDSTDGLSCAYTLGDPGCTITPQSAGVHALVVTYPGNGDIAASSTTAAQAVLAIPTATALQASPGATTFGNAVSLQAALAFAGDLVPNGTVAFCDGGSPGDATFCASGTPLCASAPLSATTPHVATCTAPSLAAGTHAVVARYAGNTQFAASASGPASVEIARAPTSVVLSVSPPSIVLGESVNVTATVASGVAAQIAVPGGTIAVDDGAGRTCTITLPATSCTLAPGNAGAHVVTAAYGGASNFATSSASTALAVGEPPAQLALAIDDGVDHARYGQPLTYTIVLTNSGGSIQGLAVTGTPSANFGGATLTWSCAATNGATCMASGSGPMFADSVALPPNGSLTWTVQATVPANAAGDKVTFDVRAGDASARDSDTLVLFRNGFE